MERGEVITRTCDGCGRRIADDDRHALRDLPMYDIPTSAPTGPHDYCGECVTIVRTELPKLAAQAREARRAAAREPVRSRALTLWKGGTAPARPPHQRA